MAAAAPPVADQTSSSLSYFLLHRGLRISVEASKGRCLVANRSFKRGETVLEQDPFCAVLDANSSNLRCDGCFIFSDNLLRCSACKTVRYCSVVCQRREWKLHKGECKIMSSRPMQEKQRLQTPTLRLMVRLLVKRRLQSDGVILRTPADTFELVEALPTHFSETSAERLVLFGQMANLVKLVVSPMEVDLKETAHLFCRFACNAHTICDEELRPLGTGLYPVVSIINHSCSPNAVLLFDGKKAIVRCLENVTEGTEVTVSYVDLAASTPTRQKALKEQYYFECCCTRCMRRETSEGMIEDAILEGCRCLKPDCEGASLPLSDGKRLVCYSCGSIQVEMKVKALGLDTRKLLEEASKANVSGSDIRARELYQQGEALQAKVWHRYSVHLMRTRDSLLKICMSLQDWTAAQLYCQMTIPAYERAYSSHSPLLGLQYFTLGKLEWFLSNTKEAVEALTQAMEILSITHSSSSILVLELSSLLHEARAEGAFQDHQQGML
ncbi:unnamed protein product [Calypogeia fissa]